MWSVFRLRRPLGDADRDAVAAEVEELFAQLADEDVVVRGTLRRRRPARRRRPHGLVARRDRRGRCRTAYHRFRRTGVRPRASTPVWSQMALHRPAEFNKSHIPAFLADEEPRALRLRLPVRALLRLVPPATTRSAARMLAEHGQMARDYPDVRANTVAVVRARRLRVDAGLRGRRAAPHRRPDAPPARLRGPAARARGGAVLHRRRRTPVATWSPPCPDRVRIVRHVWHHAVPSRGPRA